MRSLWPAILLLLSPQEDLYKAMSDRIDQARTLRVEYTITLGQGEQVFATFHGAVRAKGKDRWSMDLRLQQGERRVKEKQSLSLVSDGRKVVVSNGPEGYPAGSLQPEAVAAEIRRSFSTSMISQAFYIEPRELRDESRHKPPERGPVTAGGKEKVGDRDAQVFEYTLKYEGGELRGETLSVKLWVDAKEKRPLRRELGFQGMRWTETFTAFALDEEIADGEFAFQSKKRLAEARAGQLAESVRLYGHFTGRPPASLEDLVRRPASLEPEVFWPEGGFVLGGAVPKSFELKPGPDGLRLVSPDASVLVPPASRRAVAAPTDRLKKHYTARVHLHLLAAAVRAFRAAYGELPKKKAALWEKPEWAEVWPEGGFIPGGKIPGDPWGEAYRIVSDAAYVRVQVNDPKARALAVRALTAEEKRALEAAAQPRVGEAEKKEIAKVLDEMGDDDLETREQALVKLKGWGAAAIPFLEARSKTEKDAEARGRLMAARQEIPMPPAAYLAELSALSITVGSGGAMSGRGASNERNASACLKTIATAEADFRANDRDNNRVNDYWVGDVAGLYSLKEGGQSIKLIEVSMALADAAPLEAGAAGGKIPALTDFGQPAPKAGYHYRVMTHDNSSGKSEPYAAETNPDDKMGKVHSNASFGFCAYPAEYGVTGTRTFIINEGNTIFWKDTAGEAVLEWPSDDELKAEWHKLD